MFGKLVVLFAILAVAFARPQLYSGYGYNGYAANYPGYSAYSGYANPYTYGSYGLYSGLPTSNFGYGYY